MDFVEGKNANALVSCFIENQLLQSWWKAEIVCVCFFQLFALCRWPKNVMKPATFTVNKPLQFITAAIASAKDNAIALVSDSILCYMLRKDE